jgi:hypothetical protein
MRAMVAILVGCSLLTAVFPASAEDTGDSAKPMWKQEEFIISSFQVLPSEGWDLAFIRRYADAGFNLLETNIARPDAVGWQSLSDEEHRRLLDLCAEVGVKVLAVDHPRFTGRTQSDEGAQVAEENVRGAIEAYGGHPALYGYYLWDEPSIEVFEDLRKTQDLFQRLDPSRLPYTVLLPSYGPYAWEHAENQSGYTEYVRRFVEVVDPPVLGFDYYPFREAGFADGYWSDLEFLRTVAVEKDLPFWVYIQSCGWPGMKSPTVAEIRFQANIAAAYGATAIQYFVYHSVTTGGLTFGDAPATGEGSPQANYEGVTAINRQLAAWGPVLMTLRSIGVYHSGEDIHKDTTPASACPLLRAASPGLVIGHFNDPAGADYFLVVNRDYAEETEVTLELAETTLVSVVRGAGDAQALSDAPLDTVLVDLAPGGGMLLRLGPAAP